MSVFRYEKTNPVITFVTYTSLAGAGHGGDQFETDENVALMISFLDKYLK